MGRKFAELIPTTGRYVDGADKAMLAADPDAEKADERAAAMRGPVALRLIGSSFQPRARFGPRWLVTCRPYAGGEDIAIDFAAADKSGTVPIEARMSMFAELRDSLDAGEAWDPVILARVPGVKGGNPFWTFLDAPADLVVEPVAPVYLDDEDEPEPWPVEVKGPRLVKATARK